MEVAVEFRMARAPLRFVIDEPSKVGEARRAAQTLANFEFNADMASDVAIAATELANNLIRHAGGGELLVQHIGDDEHSAIELLAIDRGPGMYDIERCMTDGYSTIGTPGTGLGAVRRLANEFDIHSRPTEGTVVMARFGHALPLRHGAVNVAIEGEVECGDAWQVAKSEHGIAAVVVDGLGHGSFAAEAARACLDAFSADPFAAPQDVMTRANASMSGTRGGAGACALINGDSLAYSGVGNIGGTLVTPGKSLGLVSHNGTLGINQRRTQQFQYACAPGALLIMHSDGVSGRWDLKNRPDLLACHPSVIAAALYRDHGRGRDDATVLVVAP